MATSSLTKEFVIDDPEVYERLMKIINKPKLIPEYKKEITPSVLDEGIELFLKSFSR